MWLTFERVSSGKPPDKATLIWLWYFWSDSLDFGNSKHTNYSRIKLINQFLVIVHRHAPMTSQSMKSKITVLYLHVYLYKNKSKGEAKDQESIQSSITPDPVHNMVKEQNPKKRSHTRAPRGHSFPSR